MVGIYVSRFCRGNIAKNNIVRIENAVDTYFVQVNTGAGETGDIIADNNDYYCENFTDKWNFLGALPDTLAAWRIASGGDANAIDDDPDFVNEGADDYHLQVTSPCVGAGAIGTGVTEDYDGVTRGDPPDIGAYQFVP